jgi:hypothetical protein
MADTGVPTALSKTYADPAQGYAAAANAVPQAAQLAEAQRRTGIDQQNADTSAANARTQEFAARSSADLAKLTQAMQSRESDARVAKFKLDTALDAALFDNKKRTAEANLDKLITGNEAANREHLDRISNDRIYAEFSLWKSGLDPERTMLDPKVQEEFAGFFNAAKGLEMKRLLQSEFEKAKGDSFQMSQTHLASVWSPDIGAKLLDGWGTLTPGQKAFRVEVGKNRMREQEALAAIGTFNEKVRPTAPDMVLKPELFVSGEDDFKNPTYNVHRIASALADGNARYEAELKTVSEGLAESESWIKEKVRGGQARYEDLTKQLNSVRSNLRNLATARESKAPDAMDLFFGRFLLENKVDPARVAEVTAPPTNDLERAARDIARTKLLTEAATDWKKQEDLLVEQVAGQEKLDPRKEYGDLTKRVSKNVDDFKYLESKLGKEIEFGGKVLTVTPEIVAASKAALRDARDALDSFGGKPHSHFYDGTYSVHPGGLPRPTPTE